MHAITAELTIRIGRKSYAIPDYATASRMVCEARDRSGIGGSRFRSPLIYEGDKQVAHVSYNGRVWAGASGRDWKPGDVPLFDNREGI